MARIENNPSKMQTANCVKVLILAIRSALAVLVQD